MKFETINGTLCRMVEPEPLTPESKFPCVVRLIQDETMLGKANIRACHPETLASKRICSELTDNGLFMDGNYTYRYEIIGYPVVDGSHWWALWQAENGKSFEHKTAHHCRIFTMFSETELRVTNEEGEVVEFVDIDRFLSEGAKDGWQLYEPQPKPEPPKEPDYVICKRCGGSQSVPSPEVSTTAYAVCPKCGGTGYEIKPETAKEQFEVGDWVEYRGSFGIHIGRIDNVSPNGSKVHIHVSDAYGLGVDVSTLRKLAPSQVVITIGCLKGTVAPVSINGIHLWFHLVGVNRKTIATIRIESLDTSTRELVESLLKAQIKENA